MRPRPLALFLALLAAPCRAASTDTKPAEAADFRGPDRFRSSADAMFHDLSSEARQAAALTVISYPGSESLALLERFLDEERGPEVRAAACLELSTAAAHRVDPEGTGILTRVLLQDPELEVRSAALHGLSLRGDRRALDALRRASASEADEGLRKRIRDLIKRLAEPPKVEAPKRGKAPKVSPNAVKGVDFCGDGNGWCECGSGPVLRPHPRCIPKDDCIFLYENSYKRQGYVCTWDGGSLD